MLQVTAPFFTLSQSLCARRRLVASVAQNRVSDRSMAGNTLDLFSFSLSLYVTRPCGLGFCTLYFGLLYRRCRLFRAPDVMGGVLKKTRRERAGQGWSS